MKDPQPHPFDFRKPSGLALETVDQMTVWLDSFSNLFKEKWPTLAATEVDIRYKSEHALSFGMARSRMPKPAIAFQMSISGEKFPTLFVMHRQPTIEMVLEMLGESQSELPDDRSLSAVEYSLAELFFNELASALSESWPDQHSLPCEVTAFDSQPNRSRLFAPKSVVLVFQFDVSLTSGSHEMIWIVPQQELETLLEITLPVEHEVKEQSRSLLEMKAAEMEVILSVSLGNTELQVHQLANLSVGDVIVLDQRITEPLSVSVHSCKKFHAWPGRCRATQAIQICETI